MNLEEELVPQPTTTTITQQPSQSHLRLSSCPRHPVESFTGFCPSCLRERLAGLDTSTSTSTSTSTRPKTTSSTASAALKAIFRTSDNNRTNKPSTSGSTSLLPELRRCKSFSGGKGEGFGFSGVFEPQRRSCDVRGRNSLWSLFNQDDVRKFGEIQFETTDLGFSGVSEPVQEEEDELEQEEEEEEQEIRVSDTNVEEREEEVEEEIEECIIQEQEGEGEEKPMKDHIEIDLQVKKPPSRDFKEIAGSFWTAASVFSKKLQKWRSKQKRKKRGGGGEGDGVGDGASTVMQADKPYSEIGEYGFGRRSCDIDPRFSLDAARMSYDDPRYSWDEPRASWDGYMIGRMFPRVPPMLSVVEHVGRSDDQIPVEEQPGFNEGGDTTPGGTAQTRDYYSDSSSSQRRRKSLDRSNSIRKKAAAIVAELDEAKSISNAKVTPATTELFHGTKVLVTDRNLRDSHSNSNSLRDDCSESFESVFRDNASIASAKGMKKSRRWSKAWNIWGLISKRGGSKDDEEDRCSSRAHVVQRSFSESWSELRSEPNGAAKGGVNRVYRSNSSVSSRNLHNMGGSLGGIRRSNAETNGQGKKKREECILERNRSARYSPNNLDNGLLRFYLTPMRSSRRNGSGKSRPRTSHSIASSILRLY